MNHLYCIQTADGWMCGGNGHDAGAPHVVERLGGLPVAPVQTIVGIINGIAFGTPLADLAAWHHGIRTAVRYGSIPRKGSSCSSAN